MELGTPDFKNCELSMDEKKCKASHVYRAINSIEKTSYITRFLTVDNTLTFIWGSLDPGFAEGTKSLR